MTLEKIEICNYRSIAHETLMIKKVNNSSTYCLLGINEAGKSSFLKGLALYDAKTVEYPQDFFDESQPVKLSLSYKVTPDDLNTLRNLLIKTLLFPKELANQIEISAVTITVAFSAKTNSEKETIQNIVFKKETLKGYKLDGKNPVKFEKGDSIDKEINLTEYFETNLPKHFWSYSHNVLFWESNDKYLINDEIDLTTFAADPYEVSTPLTNCFSLAGIDAEKIPGVIEKLIKPAPIRNLESLLSESVTDHIKAVWPEHPVSIKFEVNNNKNFFIN